METFCPALAALQPEDEAKYCSSAVETMFAAMPVVMATETCEFDAPDGSTHCAVPGVKHVCCDLVKAAASCGDSKGCMQEKMQNGLLLELLQAGFSPSSNMETFCPAL